MTTFFRGRSGLSTCAAAVIAALGVAGPPVLASGPHAGCETYRPVQAMSKDLGSKSALAFFLSKNGACEVALMISEKYDPAGAAGPASAARVRLILPPGQSVSMDSEEGDSLIIQCGPDASVMNVTTGSRAQISALRQNIGLSFCALDPPQSARRGR